MIEIFIQLKICCFKIHTKNIKIKRINARLFRRLGVKIDFYAQKNLQILNLQVKLPIGADDENRTHVISLEG